MADTIIKDSSIWSDPSNLAAVNRLDGLIRIGIVKGAFNDEDTGELRYLVEIQSNAKKINLNCRMMRRWGGVFNYEDYILHGYKTNDAPDPVEGFDAKAGDAVLVTQLNGQGREGVILGGLTHAARETTLDTEDGPQYEAEFNGIKTEINSDGEWTLTFRGQPTNLDALDDTPDDALPEPEYDLEVGTSYMMFDKAGGWTVDDNATEDPQSLFIDKENGTVTLTSGQISLLMTKADQSVALTCQDLTIDSTNSITENTTDYTLKASGSAKFDSPQIAIGHEGIELLDQLTQLIDAIGKLLPLSPVGPCTALNTVPPWPQIEQIKSKINQIKGSL